MQDAEEREADIWLCMSGNQHLPTIGEGAVFILITQVRDETVAVTPSESVAIKGDRVISFCVRPQVSGGLDLQGKPPRPDLCFSE